MIAVLMTNKDKAKETFSVYIMDYVVNRLQFLNFL